MKHFNLLGTAIDHNNSPHLCIELSDDEFEFVQQTVDMTRARHPFDLKQAILHMIREHRKEMDRDEEAGKQKGWRVG